MNTRDALKQKPDLTHYCGGDCSAVQDSPEEFHKKSNKRFPLNVQQQSSDQDQVNITVTHFLRNQMQVYCNTCRQFLETMNY